MSVDESLWRNWYSQSTKSTRHTGSLAFRRRLGCSATLFELLRGNENYISSEVANFPKILNGPKGNKASKTAASVEILNGLENPHGVRLPEKLWKCSKRWLKEDNPLGGVLFYKSNFLVSRTWTCHDPVGHTSNSTVTTSTGDSTEHIEDEGLGVNICCSSGSPLCQTGNNSGNSCNSPFEPLWERNLAGRTGKPRTLWLRGAARKQQETRRKGRWNIRARFPVSDDGDIPSLEREADFYLGRWKSASKEVFASTAV